MGDHEKDHEKRPETDQQEPVADAPPAEVGDEELEHVSGGNMHLRNPKSPFDPEP